MKRLIRFGSGVLVGTAALFAAASAAPRTASAFGCVESAGAVYTSCTTHIHDDADNHTTCCYWRLSGGDRGSEVFSGCCDQAAL